MVTGAPPALAALTDAATSPMTTASSVALDQAMATAGDGAMMTTTIAATWAAIRATIHTRKPAGMSGERAILWKLSASLAMAIGTERLLTTIAIAVGRL